jgi:acyl-CoA reductase-like NAD-dependent aldehyde dehydrogenase
MSEVKVAGVVVPHPDAVFVGDDWIPATGAAYEVVSPATEQPVAEVVLPGEKEARAAVEAAHEAGRTSWGSLPTPSRVEICGRFCSALQARFSDLGAVWAAEAGMPVRYSATLHKYGAVGAWSSALAGVQDALRDDVRPSMLGEVVVRRQAAGVVLAIMAYNGPLVTMATKVIPALLAGCPVVVQAAPESQLIMRIIGECAASAGFGFGALSILCGDAEVGRLMTADPRVDMVSLTGGQAAA